MGDLSTKIGKIEPLVNRYHTPVLLKEVSEYLKIKKGGHYLDTTVGGGGHAEAILKFGGKLLAIDCDPEALEAAREYLSSACPNTSWRLARGNFKDLKRIAERNGFGKIDGVLFDLGVSSHQLETSSRGFSFNLKGPLDMRMDPGLKVTAADLVNVLNKGELEELFEKFGQEYRAGRLAEAIVNARRLRPIKTCNDLAKIIVQAKGKREKFDRTHPATRVFQALRMAVNDELNNLRQALPQAVGILKTEGRLVVISFHSGEDRVVKQFLKEKQAVGQIRIITKKPIRPTASEIGHNPRSRSAKLRAGEKL